MKNRFTELRDKIIEQTTLETWITEKELLKFNTMINSLITVPSAYESILEEDMIKSNIEYEQWGKIVYDIMNTLIKNSTFKKLMLDEVEKKEERSLNSCEVKQIYTNYKKN